MTPQRLNWIAWVKLGAVFSGLLLSGATAQGGQTQPPTDVTVYVTGARAIPSAKYGAAKEIAGTIFIRIGIRIVWRDREPDRTSAKLAIHMQIVRKPGSENALANALPFAQGVKVVTVSWDRVHWVAGGSSLEPHLLAYVMAHEIGHILQVSDQHAQSGLMKASWNEQDYAAMEKGLLEFTSDDLELIRHGLSLLKAARESNPVHLTLYVQGSKTAPS